MKDYTFSKQNSLTISDIQKIINNFEFTQKPILQKYKDYYDGKQKICFKEDDGTGKPNNRIVVNYCADIVDNYSGYMSGLPVSYNSQQEQFQEIQEVLNYNDVKAEDSDILTDALIYGKSFEVVYLDENAKTRFGRFEPTECIAIYDNVINGELLYVIRYYQEFSIAFDNQNIKYCIDVYDSNYITHYKADGQFGTMQYTGQEKHYFNQVPVIVVNLNKERTAVFDKVIGLQDAYNTTLSDEINDFDSFADAYMILKGGTLTEEDLDLLRRKRMIHLDSSEDSVEYLTKQVNDAQIKDMLDNINDQIHKISASPDFNSDKFLAASGISMRYKLTAFENNASKIESNWKKGLQKRLELICAILDLTGSEATWRDIQIQFTRNLPVNLLDAAQVINSLRGLVSTQTLLGLLPFISDPRAELEALQAEQAQSVDMYTFGGNGADTDTQDEEAPAEVN